jgi:DNA replication protein DnaC
MRSDPALFGLRLATLQRPDCVGKTDDEVQTEARQKHEQMQLGMLPNLLLRWQAGELEREVILAGPRDTPALTHVRDFAADRSLKSLVLSGGPGSGKTVAALVWLTIAARRPIHPPVDGAGNVHDASSYLGNSWAWDETARMCSPYKMPLLSNSYDRADRLEWDSLERAMYLVLDDLGGEGNHQQFQPALERLIYERNRTGRWTVITTNLLPSEEPRKGFKEIYGDRVWSRVNQFGGFKGCGAQDLRRQQ